MFRQPPTALAAPCQPHRWLAETGNEPLRRNIGRSGRTRATEASDKELVCALTVESWPVSPGSGMDGPVGGGGSNLAEVLEVPLLPGSLGVPLSVEQGEVGVPAHDPGHQLVEPLATARFRGQEPVELDYRSVFYFLLERKLARPPSTPNT